MGKSGAMIYLAYVSIILAAGYYVYNKVTDIKDPASIRSNLKELDDTLNENF